jgi:hypothetical protein
MKIKELKKLGEEVQKASKFLVFEVSEELHTRFKIYCIQKKTTMQGELTNFLKKLLEADKIG